MQPCTPFEGTACPLPWPGIDLTLSHLPEIEAYAARDQAVRPWAARPWATPRRA